MKFKRCDIDECEAVCCYDGAYLTPDDEKKITEAVKTNRDFFKNLPADYIIDGNWRDQVQGRKTAVRPHEYRNPIAPHFNQTRCVFANEQGLCLLQIFAEKNGHHPWTYKPDTCWKFPLRENNEGELLIPSSRKNDPHNMGQDYPGFSSYTECGKNKRGGDPWQTVFAEEVSYAKKIL